MQAMTHIFNGDIGAARSALGEIPNLEANDILFRQMQEAGETLVALSRERYHANRKERRLAARGKGKSKT